MAVNNRAETALPPMRMDALADLVLDPLTKGLPFGTAGLRLGDVGRQGWSLLDGSLAVINIAHAQTAIAPSGL